MPEFNMYTLHGKEVRALADVRCVNGVELPAGSQFLVIYADDRGIVARPEHYSWYTILQHGEFSSET